MIYMRNPHSLQHGRSGRMPCMAAPPVVVLWDRHVSKHWGTPVLILQVVFSHLISCSSGNFSGATLVPPEHPPRVQSGRVWA